MISGAAIVAENLAKQMAAHGHQVLVIAASDKTHPYVTIAENLTILRLQAYPNPLRVGQRFLIYPRKTVLCALRQFQPDIIHSHDPLQMGLLGLEYTRQIHIPSVLTTHQLPWFAASYLPRKISPLIEKPLWLYAHWLLNQFTAIVAPSQTIATLITQTTGHEVAVIGSGIDLKAFHPRLTPKEDIIVRQKWNLPPDLPLILHVGRLDTDKHVDRVIRAAALTLCESDAHLVIVGDGQQKAHLLQLCERLRIAHRVHFTGYIHVEQGLPEIYRLATLFVTASEIETQGIVLLEAAACGLPIAAVRATCIPEVVHHGVNGYLAEPGDSATLGKWMGEILQSSSLAQAMGKESRILAEKHGSRITLEKYAKFYRQLNPAFFYSSSALEQAI